MVGLRRSETTETRTRSGSRGGGGGGSGGGGCGRSVTIAARGAKLGAIGTRDGPPVAFNLALVVSRSPVYCLRQKEGAMDAIGNPSRCDCLCPPAPSVFRSVVCGLSYLPPAADNAADRLHLAIRCSSKRNISKRYVVKGVRDAFRSVRVYVSATIRGKSDMRQAILTC